jgi:hypothetical protein
MSGLQKLKDRLTPGTLLTCVRNTYLPYRDGTQHFVTGLHKQQVGCQRLTEGVRPPRGEGAVTIMLPERADLVWVDSDTVRWPLGIGAHSVTYRIGSAE